MTRLWKTIGKEQFPLIKPLLQDVIKQEEYLTLPANASDEDCVAYWFGNGKGEVFVLEEDGKVQGTFYLRPNHFGLGAHIANAGYVVAKYTRGKGIGKILGEKSIEEAKRKGFKAIQFNFVVSTNEAAVRLWKNLGFNVIGTIPKAYYLKQKEYVDALVMHRTL